jgi:hypothetical protein
VVSYKPISADSAENTYTLSRNISAIQVLPDSNDGVRLGTILQLPEGAQVRMTGEGFNERTVRVFWEGANYFVFLEDIGPNRPFATGTSVGR